MLLIITGRFKRPCFLINFSLSVGAMTLGMYLLFNKLAREHEFPPMCYWFASTIMTCVTAVELNSEGRQIINAMQHDLETCSNARSNVMKIVSDIEKFNHSID